MPSIKFLHLSIEGSEETLRAAMSTISQAIDTFAGEPRRQVLAAPRDIALRFAPAAIEAQPLAADPATGRRERPLGQKRTYRRSQKALATQSGTEAGSGVAANHGRPAAAPKPPNPANQGLSMASAIRQALGKGPKTIKQVQEYWGRLGHSFDEIKLSQNIYALRAAGHAKRMTEDANLGSDGRWELTDAGQEKLR